MAVSQVPYCLFSTLLWRMRKPRFRLWIVPVRRKLVRLETRPRLLLCLEECEMVPPHPAASLRHDKSPLLKLLNSLLEWDPVHIVRDMMHTLAVLVEELLEDVGAADRLDDLVYHRW